MKEGGDIVNSIKEMLLIIFRVLVFFTILMGLYLIVKTFPEGSLIIFMVIWLLFIYNNNKY